MLTELFVREVAKLATAADAPRNRVIQVPGEATHVYYLLDAEGNPTRRLAEPPLARAVALSVPAVAEWMKTMSDESASVAPAVWYSRHGVVGVHDGRERITLKLKVSLPLAKLCEVAQHADGQTFEQGHLWRLLRTLWRDALPSHPDLRRQVERVDIKKAQEASGEVSRKGVSVSRSLLAEAAGADQLPEVLTFSVPVFDTPAVPATATVRVAFDLDAQAERFRLCVLPGQIEAAFAEGEAAVYRQVADALAALKLDVPVYYGTPE